MTKQVNDNILNWFRNEFVPNASDETIARLWYFYIINMAKNYQLLKALRNLLKRKHKD